MEKLRETYEKVVRRSDFTFSQGRNEYSKHVINVTFKYNNKEFNQIFPDIFVKFGYKYEELTFEDCIAIVDRELVGIQTNKLVDIPVQADLLGEYFSYHSGVYIQTKTIRVINGVAELRDHLYNNGFVCDGVKFCRLKRSSGSSRVGKCLFVNERLYARFHRWETCGIDIKKDEEIDLAGFESYIAVTSSSIIDKITIQSKNILVIDDYDSVFMDDVIVTDVEEGWLRSYRKNIEIRNSIWDGQSLLDKSCFGKYSDKGMLLLRNRFFKSACFNTNIQQFFKDNGITRISQLNGFTLADDIKDIKLITTPNSIKYLKFGRLIDWLSEIESGFGIVKYEKKTPFFEGRFVQTHYQLLNTLQLSQQEVEDFLRPSLDFLHLLKTEPSVLRYYIRYQHNEFISPQPLITKNDVVYRMIGITDKFCRTKLYKDFRKDLVKAFTKNLRCGHVLVNGNYSTLCGNPVEMLFASIGKFDGSTYTLQPGTVYSTRFEFEKEILGSRSPHVTCGNILVTKNVYNAWIDRYMNSTDEIIYVNSINENLLSRLSGCDFDSDTMLITDDPILLSAAKKNYDMFLVPTSDVHAKKTKRKYNASELADLDIKTSENKIGEIINLSQELNTKMWEALNSGQSFEDVELLYYDICKLDVMSNIEIDKAKKEFEVDTVAELKKIKEEYQERDEDGRLIKPNFFGVIARAKNYYDPQKKNYKRHNTTMDYLQQVILSNAVRTRVQEKTAGFSDILDKTGYNSSFVKRDQIRRVIDNVRETKLKMNGIWTNAEMDPTVDRHALSMDARQKCIDYVSSIKMSHSTMYWLVKMIEAKENKDISRMLFYVLFSTPHESFFELILASKRPIETLVEDESGDIYIYGIRFKKTP